jgi:hypothetical protein
VEVDIFWTLETGQLVFFAQLKDVVENHLFEVVVLASLSEVECQTYN